MNTLSYAEFRSHVLRYYGTKSPAALGKMRHVMDLLEVQGVRSTADLTTITAARFVADRGPGANPNTTRGLIAYFKAACNFAVEEDWMDRSPNWRRVTPASAPSIRQKVIKPPDVVRLLSRLEEDRDDWRGHRLFALASLIAHSGLRIREALHMQVQDFDLAGGFLSVVPRRRLKTSASANTVPLPDHVVEAMRAWVARCGSIWVFPGLKRIGPWTGGEFGRRSIDALRVAAAAVGIPWISWHALRHTYATTAVRDWGLPLWAVQRILRHTSARTTELYLGGDDTSKLVGLVRGLGYAAH